jgi:eukaryotic-like serine/threonine-protein kinase
MTQFGKYDIIAEIGRGGFGVVYQARDLSLERDVALKVLHPQLTVDPRFIENFHREARNLARINHPNVVTVHEIGEEDGRLFIAMEYLPGGSLEDRLKREGPCFRLLTP